MENKRQQIENVQSSKEAARELASQAGKLKIIYGKVNLGIVGENFRVLFPGCMEDWCPIAAEAENYLKLYQNQTSGDL